MIEVVDQWPRLGHIITNRCTDDADILNRRNCMVGQINTVLCYFGKLPSCVKSKLLYTYCGSLYGCELWDSFNNTISSVCVAWRKALRKVWNLPFITHYDFLFELSNVLPVFDVICKRVLSFISKCVNSDCDIVQSVPRHAIWHGCMSSPLGRSGVFCSLRYKFDIGCLLNLKFNHCSVVWNHYISTRSSEMSAKVAVLRDMLLFREDPSLCIGLLCEIATAIKCICIE